MKKMIKKVVYPKYTIHIFTVILIFLIIAVDFIFPNKISSASAAPTLLFSDLESGPKTGWEGSATIGAAVTVWGTGFGSVRGESYITVNGANLTSDSSYAEWGVTANNARGLERITFWLNNNAQDGAGTITVTVGGITSNTLPFTVRSGNIYFIAKDGNDNNNGTRASNQGGGNGPWLSFYKTNGQDNSVLQQGDIIYIRSGTYNDIDEQSRMIYYRGLNYSSGSSLAVIGYPGEFPVLGTSVTIGIYTDAGYGENSYLEWHKMIFENSSSAFHLNGHNFRIVGNIFRNNTADAWTGVISGGSIWDSQILGNIWRDTGYDNYKHAIYLTGQTWNRHSTLNHAVSNINIGWNEFDHYIGDGNAPNNMGGGTIEIKSKDNPNWTNAVYVHDNYFHNVTANLMWVTENCYNIYFYNNISWDSSHVATGISRGGILWGTWNSDDRFYQYNNTFYNIGDNQSGYNIGSTFVRQASRVQSKNNIYYSINSQTYLRIDSTNGATLISDSDLYYGNGSPPSGAGITVINPINSDPQFVSTTNNDFHLQINSPAIDAGTSNVGIILLNDYDNNPRPMDGDNDGLAEYDIGAYEYLAAGSPTPDTTPPTPPTGLQAQ